MKRIILNNRGQSLITLVIFMVVSVIVITGAVALIVINTRATGKFYQSNVAQAVAEAGIENALIRFLRDPSYSGETMTINSNTAQISVLDNGDGTYEIESQGTSGNFLKTITATVSYNGTMTITSWSQK